MDSLSDVVRSLRAKKALGQHFLTDSQILRRIIEGAGPLGGRTVIEVGPGPGGLTEEMISHPCGEIILVERDRRFIPHLESLRERFGRKMSVLNEDALLLPLESFGQAPRKIIANLPYNISVPLLIRWLQHINEFESLTLMFQKEVAERLVAAPNTSAYGRLSIMCQWRSRVTKLFDLHPGAFVPPPKVASTVVHITPSSPCLPVSWQALETVTRAAFSQRRKMLRSSLKGVISSPQLEDLGIDPERRAETVTVHEFCRLAVLWEKECVSSSL